MLSAQEQEELDKKRYINERLAKDPVGYTDSLQKISKLESKNQRLKNDICLLIAILFMFVVFGGILFFVSSYAFKCNHNNCHVDVEKQSQEIKGNIK